MLNIKLVFMTWDNPQRVLFYPEGKIKYAFTTKLHLKIMKFVTNFEKSVLGS